MPVVCNDRCRGGRCRLAQFIDVVDVPVIMRGSGSAPDSVHRGYGGHSSSQQRQVLGSHLGGYGGDERVVGVGEFFSAVLTLFFALLRLSRS